VNTIRLATHWRNWGPGVATRYRLQTMRSPHLALSERLRQRPSKKRR
jgi:hypothetical protein